MSYSFKIRFFRGSFGWEGEEGIRIFRWLLHEAKIPFRTWKRHNPVLAVKDDSNWDCMFFEFGATEGEYPLPNLLKNDFGQVLDYILAVAKVLKTRPDFDGQYWVREIINFFQVESTFKTAENAEELIQQINTFKTRFLH